MVLGLKALKGSGTLDASYFVERQRSLKRHWRKYSTVAMQTPGFWKCQYHGTTIKESRLWQAVWCLEDSESQKSAMEPYAIGFWFCLDLL